MEIKAFIMSYFQCTKTKAWKDIAAQLGIGASSSGAYTLKKHYGKTLLPFECHFDRGGVDPGPILAQVEAQQTKGKKSSASGKNSSNPPPAPSPGSQDSRDSFSNSSNQNSESSYGAPPVGMNSGMGPGYAPSTPQGPISACAPGSYNNYPVGVSSVDGGRPPSHPGKWSLLFADFQDKKRYRNKIDLI